MTTLTNLENYINDNINIKEDNQYYNESFCNLVFDYIGIMGVLSEEDKIYLSSKDYDESDFIED